MISFSSSFVHKNASDSSCKVTTTPNFYTTIERKVFFVHFKKYFQPFFNGNLQNEKKSGFESRNNMSIFEVEWLIKQSEQPDVLEVQKELKQQ